MTRILRCAACARRIKPQHPHIGVEDHDAGREISYHARPACQKRATDETLARLEAGRVYVLHHYHSALCPDAAAGFGCSAGCFDTAPREVAN